MCGIIGFTGKLKAQDVLLTGLASLEYRGYDSAGIAYFKDTGKISLRKTVGKVKDLRAICDDDNNSTCGIGHTRWATHGEPSDRNSHPHLGGKGKVAVVHNGIIENYQEIKDRLLNKGFTFVSQTDTEVVAQLLDYYYTGESAGNALDAITRMMLSDEKGYNAGRIDYHADHGWLTLDVPAHSGVLLSSGVLV